MKTREESIADAIYSELIPIEAIEEIEDVCVHIVDDSGKIICYSKGCEIIEEMPRDAVINKKTQDVYQFIENESTQLKVLKTGQKIVNAHVKYTSPSGKIADVISSNYPFFSKADPKKVVASICIFRDIPDYMNMANTIGKLQEDLKSQQFKNNGTQFTFSDVVGSSSELSECIRQGKIAGETTAPILISGATGTGKEVFAQSIHNFSQKGDAPFIAINCGAIPENLLESTLFGTTKGSFTGAVDTKGLIATAHGGTLFLDEINSMNLTLQSKLLRVLETGKYRKVGGERELTASIRILSALNQDPLKAIAEKRLRSDLYYRLAVFSIHLPSLEERKKDIIELALHFLSVQGGAMGKRLYEISPETKTILLEHDWPGNIRELKHVITHAIHMSQHQDTILLPELLPFYLTKNRTKTKVIDKYLNDPENDTSLKSIMNKVERDIILEVLQNNDFNISQSARDLGMLRQNLQYRIKMHQIKKNQD